MKVLSFYLPQFHTFPENDAWWGKGFTEWTNTKKAKPLFPGHYQPHVPLDNNYYDLTEPSVMRGQITIAKKYGIYGFCFYHYWFKNGKKLMEAPVERFLQEKELDINFCLSWANEPWTRAWDGGRNEIIMEQEYGDSSEWEKHFCYLLPYFLDKRYIYEDNKPLLIIYRPELIPCFDEMINMWKKLAVENGLDGLFIMAQGADCCVKSQWKKYSDLIDGYIMYEPGFTYGQFNLSNGRYAIRNILKNFEFSCKYLPRKYFSRLKDKLSIKIKRPLDICDFNILWNSILRHEIRDDYYPGAFSGWDNSPRRGSNGRIVVNSTPEKFETFFEKQIIRTRNLYKKDFMFFTAWNEWAEGSHLEPDDKFGYKYLEAVKTALINTEEWPF